MRYSIKLQDRTDGPGLAPNANVYTVCMLMGYLRVKVHEGRYVSIRSFF